MNSLVEEANEDSIFLFGKSKFKGHTGLLIEVQRWLVQLRTLIWKNAQILTRKIFLLLIFIIIPSLIMLVFMLGRNQKALIRFSSSSNVTVSLQNLRPCKAYFENDCITLAYAPNTDADIERIVRSIAEENNLVLNKDIKGFNNTETLKLFVAENIGKVEFSVIFANQSLWQTVSPDGTLWPTQSNYSRGNILNYLVFFNTSTSLDTQSTDYGVHFPLLSLQRSLEANILKVQLSVPESPLQFVDYGEISRFEPMNVDTLSPDLNSTLCNSQLYDYSTQATAATWVFSVGLYLTSIICFTQVNDERLKGLFTALRRIGLMDSTYWISWFLSYQVILIVGSLCSLAIAAAIKAESLLLQSTDFGVIFLILWLGGMCSVSNGLFLASLCTRPSHSTVAVAMNLLILLITLILDSSTLNSANVVLIPNQYDDNQFTASCIQVASSFNALYSNNAGNGIVLFIVFFMPWVHISQAIQIVMSKTQYVGQSYTFADLSKPLQLATTMGSSSTFSSPGADMALGKMVGLSIVYLALAWLVGQLMSSDNVEGRDLFSVLVPKYVNDYFTNRKAPLEDGDKRGQERQISTIERSVRVYKCSKTFSGVQALKEVSFSVRPGECYCILGHNGAGKSTLVNILTGLIRPTHGKAFLAGYDVDTDISTIQQTIGVCAQDDFIWDELTAREHMHLYAAFKGIDSGKQLNSAVNHVLDKVGLAARADTLAKDFSGGMKRRLSVAMASVGEVEILFMDEPARGLDPLAKRQLWEVINWMKRDRVLILTTHDMFEADSLGDNILILHQGKVKALGDPFTLKQLYGTGLSVKLVVDRGIAQPSVDFVKKILPQSLLTSDWTTGSITLNVQRRDYSHMPRLFQWIEVDTVTSKAIKEWEVSNTTLEEVFLLLCVQNNQVNFVDERIRSAAETEALQLLCPLCMLRPKETVVLRATRNLDSINGDFILVPGSICLQCTTDDSFRISASDFEFSSLSEESAISLSPAASLSLTSAAQLHSTAQDTLSRQKRLEGLLQRAMNRKSHSLQGSDPTHTVEGPSMLISAEDITREWHRLTRYDATASQQTQPESDASHAAQSPILEKNRLPPAAEPFTALMSGSWKAQVLAIMRKNATLQGHQRCSNICAFIFVVLLIGVLYLLSFLFRLQYIDSCPGGWVTGSGSYELQLLADHIFSATRSGLPGQSVSGKPIRKEPLGPWGYTIDNYIIPNSYSALSSPNFRLANQDSDTDPSTAGLSFRANRFVTVWTSLFSNLSALFDIHSNGLALQMQAIPEQVYSNELSGSANEFMLQNQANIYSLANSDSKPFPQCDSYSPALCVPSQLTYPFFHGGSYNEYAQVEPAKDAFASIFADCVFECKECKNSKNSRASFNGTLWASKASKGNSYYEYAFIDFAVPANGEKLLGQECPNNTQIMTLGSSSTPFSEIQTLNAMTYLNLLTNSLADPTLQSYAVQGSVSPYGQLSFSFISVLQAVATLLTIISAVIMNSLWSLSVWRLCYERKTGISQMMKNIGMRSSAYFFGMYSFDVLFQSIVSIVAMGVAVALSTQYPGSGGFKGVPVGYLIATSILSAHSVTGLGMLVVRLAPKTSTILPTFLACLSLASSVAGSLISLLLYRDVGTWPDALSLIPFMAQCRAIYLILVYHEASEELDVALSLMFVTGVVFASVAVLLDLDFILVRAYFDMVWQYLRREPLSKGIDGNDRGARRLEDVDLGDVELGDVEPRDEDGTAIRGNRSAPASATKFTPLPQDTAVANDIDDIPIEDRNDECESPPTSDDVKAEECISMTEGAPQRFAVLIQQLWHRYNSNSPFVVKNVSLALQFGETFGLLGPNGAGKSTTLGIITGFVLNPHRGDVFVAGQSILQSQEAIHKLVGVCPQFDVVWDEFTVEEHLLFQCRQRGIEETRVRAEVQRVAQLIGLDGDGYRTQAKSLSGGMRRRLSIGMSIVGDPPVLFLDEATAGLDPENRRHVWALIDRLKRPNRLILLTTHSMEEAEVLCSRVGIIAQGRLKCIGSPAYLKQKYSTGYTITVSIAAVDEETSISRSVASAADALTLAQKVDEFMRDSIGGGEGILKSAINNTRKYSIPAHAAKLSTIFQVMESAKVELGIREWGGALASLEEVFVSAVET